MLIIYNIVQCAFRLKSLRPSLGDEFFKKYLKFFEWGWLMIEGRRGRVGENNILHNISVSKNGELEKNVLHPPPSPDPYI